MTKRTKEESFLPDDLVWAQGGHASDVVLTALADGQVEIVPPNVIAHVDGCRACTTHLGNAALLSLHAGRELALLPLAKSEAAEASARRPLPRVAIFLGLAFAGLGLVPRFLDGPPALGGAKTFAMHDLPLLVNGLGTLGRSVGIGLTYGATALLVIMAFVLVRLVPKKEVSR